MSSVPAVRAALKTLLVNSLASFDVQVIDGSPVGVTTLDPNVLMIGPITGQRSEGTQNRIRNAARNLPYDTAQDEYTVELVISVSRSGPGETTAVVSAADVIYEAARQAIESTNALDVGGLYEALPTGQFEFEPASDSNGRYCTVTFGVDITARD